MQSKLCNDDQTNNFFETPKFFIIRKNTRNKPANTPFNILNKIPLLNVKALNHCFKDAQSEDEKMSRLVQHYAHKVSVLMSTKR